MKYPGEERRKKIIFHQPPEENGMMFISRQGRTPPVKVVRDNQGRLESTPAGVKHVYQEYGKMMFGIGGQICIDIAKASKSL